MQTERKSVRKNKSLLNSPINRVCIKKIILPLSWYVFHQLDPGISTTMADIFIHLAVALCLFTNNQTADQTNLFFQSNFFPIQISSIASSLLQGLGNKREGGLWHPFKSPISPIFCILGKQRLVTACVVLLLNYRKAAAPTVLLLDGL